MFEQPPILKGSAAEQTKQLRDYLVRMVRDIQTASAPETIQQIVEQTASAGAKGAAENAVQEARRRAADLKSLIIKTADEVMQYADRIVQELDSVYVAKSDYGEFTESIHTTIEQTAEGVVESYDYSAKVNSIVGERLDDLNTYVTTIQGEIRRGFITEPGALNPTLGIVISENLSFTGTEREDGGMTYYELEEGQTFGMYTSKGWQFWINGVKAGWFDSEDGMLHVANILVEDTLQLGADWLITTVGGLGIRYIGGN